MSAKEFPALFFTLTNTTPRKLTFSTMKAVIRHSLALVPHHPKHRCLLGTKDAVPEDLDTWDFKTTWYFWQAIATIDDPESITHYSEILALAK